MCDCRALTKVFLQQRDSSEEDSRSSEEEEEEDTGMKVSSQNLTQRGSVGFMSFQQPGSESRQDRSLKRWVAKCAVQSTVLLLLLELFLN